MTTFDDLVTSRRNWLDNTLQPWCAQATRADLLKAEADWADIAGKVDPTATLWTWAWSRFPALVHEGISGINETRPVQVTLQNGQQHTGYPDARTAPPGKLLLVDSTPAGNGEQGPFSIDDITSVEVAD